MENLTLTNYKKGRDFITHNKKFFKDGGELPLENLDDAFDISTPVINSQFPESTIKSVKAVEAKRNKWATIVNRVAAQNGITMRRKGDVYLVKASQATVEATTAKYEKIARKLSSYRAPELKAGMQAHGGNYKRVSNAKIKAIVAKVLE